MTAAITRKLREGAHALADERARGRSMGEKMSPPLLLVCPSCGLSYTKQLDFCGLDGVRLVETETDPLLGRAIERYRVEELIGAGGMARVYRATHLFLGQSVALKITHGELAADRSLALRFHREAEALGSIRHENVISVLDFGATDDGVLFMAMELVDGPTLSKLIKQKGGLSPKRTAEVVRAVASGLAAAHDRGYVHRDLKPANIIMDRGEIPKILDFGLVGLFDGEDVNGTKATRLTQFGQVFGTPQYMSPEQISGEMVGHASDLYSLGIILYECLTGRPPFTGELARLAYQHVASLPPALPFSYAGLSELAMQLLSKDPARRPGSAQKVVELIEQLQIDDSTPVERTSPSLSAPSMSDMRSVVLDLEVSHREPEFVRSLTVSLPEVEVVDLRLARTRPSARSAIAGSVAVALTALSLVFGAPTAPNATELTPREIARSEATFSSVKYLPPPARAPTVPAPEKLQKVTRTMPALSVRTLQRRLSQVKDLLERIPEPQREEGYQSLIDKQAHLVSQVADSRERERSALYWNIKRLEEEAREVLAEALISGVEEKRKFDELDEILMRLRTPGSVEETSARF